MGAWSENAFGNDTACDWVSDFLEDPSIVKIEEAIARVLSEEDYLDADEACEALVACEIIARLKNQWGVKNSYSKSIDAWVESVNITPTDELTLSAKKAITRILGENSELQELWDEDGFNEDWHEEMNNLLMRISS